MTYTDWRDPGLASQTAIPAHIVAGVLKDYQPPRMMGVEGVAAKWGVSAPDTLYILWRHHVPIRTGRGGPFPPPVSLPIAWPASPPQPPIVSQAAAGQLAAGPAGPAGDGRTFPVKEVAVITGRRLDAVYNHIYTGKLRTDDCPPDGGGFTRSARRT